MKDKNYLYEMYNATSTDDGKGDLETYENWLERQLLTRIERLEQLDLHLVSKSLPNYTRCTVCHSVFVNGVGSTPCCGGMNEGLYEDEVSALGIDVSKTKNKGSKRPT